VYDGRDDTADDPGADHWERNSQWWQEGFTDGADPEYEEQILPLAAECLAGARRIVDIGTGEGQIARLACRLGAAMVVGTDPTAGQIRVAAVRAGGPAYVRGMAEWLSFRDATFDAAIACLVFEHIVGYEAAIAEVARVLEPGGRFVFMLNHPLLQAPNSGWVIDVDLDEQYWRVGPYLVPDLTMEQIAPGVVLPFLHRPLSHYVNAMARHGLLIERMEEPEPPEGFLAKAQEYRDARSIPRLLLMVARKTA
jgi:SAM-dependent methyltransferase